MDLDLAAPAFAWACSTLPTRPSMNSVDGTTFPHRRDRSFRPIRGLSLVVDSALPRVSPRRCSRAGMLLRALGADAVHGSAPRRGASRGAGG